MTAKSTDGCILTFGTTAPICSLSPQQHDHSLIASSIILIISVSLASCNFDGNLNREMATLFSLRIQIDRYESLDKVDAALSEQLARRLSTLVRAFALRIAT